MQSDTIKVIFTYFIATLLIVGGLWFLYATRLDGADTSSSTLIPLVAGFIGAAVQFVFNRETQTSTSRMVERATAAGAASGSTVTTSAGPPQTTTVTPAVPGTQP